jgi:hypothetical protein
MEQQIHRLGSVGDGGGSEDHFLSSFLVISVETGLVLHGHFLMIFHLSLFS